MSEEDYIFGPFTLRQFIVIVIAVALIAVGKQYVPDNMHAMFYIGAGIITVLAILRLSPKKIPIENLQQYLSEKKAEMTSEKYSLMVQQKIAAIRAVQTLQQKHGVPENQELTSVLAILEKNAN